MKSFKEFLNEVKTSDLTKEVVTKVVSKYIKPGGTGQRGDPDYKKVIDVFLTTKNKSLSGKLIDELDSKANLDPLTAKAIIKDLKSEFKK